MSEITRYNKYISDLLGGCIKFDFANKDKCISQHIAYMINRTQSMFRYEGLPSTMPQRDIELMLQLNGSIGVAQVDGNLYAFTGGFGGEPNVYYRPTLYTVANPALKLSKSFVIDEDIKIVGNDTLMIGLLPMLERYSTGITETELSLKLATINARIISLISSGDDRARESAEKYIEDIEKGELSVIAENEFLEGIKTQPYANSGNSNQITQLIELEQYWKASLFNELGLNANYNMKRESINAGESQLNNDALFPLVDDMLKRRQDGFDGVNDMFGTDIRVELASSWKDNKEEVEAEIEAIADENAKAEEGEDNERTDTVERPL